MVCKTNLKNQEYHIVVQRYCLVDMRKPHPPSRQTVKLEPVVIVVVVVMLSYLCFSGAYLDHLRHAQQRCNEKLYKRMLIQEMPG